MTHHAEPVAINRQKREPGGGIIMSYQISSWLVLRLFGAVFLWFAWIMWTGDWEAEGLRALWPQALPINALFGTLAALGVLLFVPFLTPSPLRFPRTVGGGVVKAVLLLLISGILYVLTIQLLADNYLKHSSELSSVVPMFIKAVAGMAVTGSVLVSLAGALRDGEVRQEAEPPKKMSEDDLRALRRARASA